MNWKKVKLGDTATFINGYAFKPTDWKTEGLPIIRIQNLTGNAYECNYFDGKVPDKYNVKDGDILVSWSASLGIYEWNGGNAVLNQHIFKVVLDKLEIDKKFMKFLLMGKLEAMKSEVHGATMQHITKGKFDNLDVNLPDLATQKHIAEVLDKADALRQQNRQLLAHYDELLQSTFIELFGDPVKNPKEWEVKECRDVISNIDAGNSFGGEQREMGDGEFAVLKISAVTSGYFKPNEYKVVQFTDIDKNLIFPKKGDLLFGRANTRELVAATCIVDKDYDRIFIPDKLWRISFHNDKCNQYYFKSLLSQDEFKQSLTKTATGTSGSMLNISMEKLKQFPIPVPPLPLQQHFAKIVEQIEAQKAQAQTALAESEALFEGLLAGYFNA